MGWFPDSTLTGYVTLDTLLKSLKRGGGEARGRNTGEWSALVVQIKGHEGLKQDNDEFSCHSEERQRLTGYGRGESQTRL